MCLRSDSWTGGIRALMNFARKTLSGDEACCVVWFESVEDAESIRGAKHGALKEVWRSLDLPVPVPYGTGAIELLNAPSRRILRPHVERHLAFLGEQEQS